HIQGAPGIPEGAGDVEQIPGAGPAPAQRGACRQSADDGDSDGEWTPGSVPAHQRATEQAGIPGEPPAERRQPDFVGGRQGQGQLEPRGRGDHGGEVAEIDPLGAPGEGLVMAGDGKVHALHQGIGADGKLAPGGRVEQGAVVAHAEGNIGAGAPDTGEEAADQVELVEGHGGARQAPDRAARISSLRLSAATLSSTPLMYRWASLGP